jgi:hypothetical protein
MSRNVADAELVTRCRERRRRGIPAGCGPGNSPGRSPAAVHLIRDALRRMAAGCA